MKKFLQITTVLMVAACGPNTTLQVDSVPFVPDAAVDAPAPLPDALPVASTWGDAIAIWTDAWCSYAERCYPEQFAVVYTDHAMCYAVGRTEQCANAPTPGLCDQPYPEDRLLWLSQCHEQMMHIVCTSTTPPTACLAAFQ